MMSRRNVPFETYCVSYDNPERDLEFKAARLVAESYNTTHNELTYDHSQLATAAEFIQCFDEPFGTFVPLHAFALSRLIGGRVKVALSGSGGDELFGGYADHRILYELDRNLPAWNKMGKAGVDWLAENSPNPSFKPYWQKCRNIVDLPYNRVLAEFRWNDIKKICSEMYSPRMRREIGETDPLDLLVEAFDECRSTNLFDGFMFQQLFVGSHHSLVHLPDIIGMAHSLEYRSPFLDRDMIELAMRIPAGLKVDLHRGDAGGKMVLREACKGLLPEEILTMPKLPFGSQIPYHSWMVGSWSDYIRTRLGSSKLADTGLFNTTLLVDRHERACRDGAPRQELDMLWGVAMISQWLEEFF
jgi:asparagine synthase (glutamine-hydrolysing)